MKPGDMTETLGFGLRVKTPIGPVRMDLGFLVWNKPEGLPGHRFHFTIGQTF
jgi:outer membrane translocation and assembly module TamA